MQDGFYQIVQGDQSHIFRVLADKQGRQILARARAYGSRVFDRFAIIKGGTLLPRATWRDAALNTSIYAAAASLLSGDAEQAGKLYAKSFGRCYVCNRLLTDQHSLETGIGPDCAGTRKHIEVTDIVE